jgi:hypothetical protein
MHVTTHATALLPTAWAMLGAAAMGLCAKQARLVRQLLDVTQTVMSLPAGFLEQHSKIECSMHQFTAEVQKAMVALAQRQHAAKQG